MESTAPVPIEPAADERGHAPRICVATVAYWTSTEEISSWMDSVSAAWERCNAQFPQATISLIVMDNSEEGRDYSRLLSLTKERGCKRFPIHIISGHGNIGYGAALNRAVLTSPSDIGIICNPDVILDENALRATISFFRRYPDAGMLSPCFVIDGRLTHLCRRLPSIAVLLMRALPFPLQRLFRPLLDEYEMADWAICSTQWDPPVASGAFMALRTERFEEVCGFDEQFFLYFEDFDLSIRLRQIARILYTNEVRVTYRTRKRKTVFALLMFGRSAFVFWKRHGFRWIRPE